MVRKRPSQFLFLLCFVVVAWANSLAFVPFSVSLLVFFGVSIVFLSTQQELNTSWVVTSVLAILQLFKGTQENTFGCLHHETNPSSLVYRCNKDLGNLGRTLCS